MLSALVVVAAVGSGAVGGVFFAWLAALDARAPGSQAGWEAYVREWTAANHVRALAGLAASAAYACALL